MTKKELLVILDQVPDDCEIELTNYINNGRDFYHETYRITELSDISYSDKKLVLEIEEEEW